MGGQTTTTQTQQSQSAPWAAAQPVLQTILGQLGTNLNNTGPTSAETAALDTLRNNAGQGNPYAGQIADYAHTMLNGGGATAQAGNVQDNLATYRKWLMPYADGSMIGTNPALNAQLAQIRTDVGDAVNSQFAAGGRDFSGAHAMAYGRGVAAGEAPVIAAQYNQDVSNRLAATNALYNGGNTTANMLAQMQQADLVNRGQGVPAAQSALDAQNYGAKAMLAEEASRRGIPVQALGVLAQLGVPIAQLGNQTNGTTTGTQDKSGVDQFATLAGGIGSLMSPFKFNFGPGK